MRFALFFFFFFFFFAKNLIEIDLMIRNSRQFRLNDKFSLSYFETKITPEAWYGNWVTILKEDTSCILYQY